jgi:hypothetical protein
MKKSIFHAAIQIHRLSSVRKFRVSWWATLIMYAGGIATGVAFWHLLGASYGITILMLCVALLINEISDNYRPALVHILSNSSSQSLLLHQKMVAYIRPFRACSLLYTDVSIPTDYVNPIVNDIFRTNDMHDWKNVAFTMAEISPVIIMDTRIPTGPVLDEIKRLIDVSLLYKVVFISDASGNCPGLDALNNTQLNQLRTAMCIINEDQLFPFVKHLISNKVNLPTLTHATKSIYQELSSRSLAMSS